MLKCRVIRSRINFFESSVSAQLFLFVSYVSMINFRFSSKTLMSLLPAEELKKIEDKVERGEMTVDFYDILGEVQKNKPVA